MPLLLLLPLLTSSLTAVPPGRVDDARAVERARYAFVIGEKPPFDSAYPRGDFEARVAAERAQERILEQAFGVTLSPARLAREFDRIENATRAPEQWQAIKHALGQDRRRVEEAFCRPVLVDRELRARFAFDERIHAEPHARARQARALLLEGHTPAGAARRVVSRRDLHPDAAAALEAQLLRRGDVSTVLSEWDRFTVYRLVERTDEAWIVEAVAFAKRDFDSWLAEVTSARP